MELVSTSNLVSPGNEKKQHLVLFKPWLRILLLYHMTLGEAKWEPMHVCEHEAICSFMMAELWKSALTNTYTQNSNKLEEKICFILKMRYFCNNLLDQSKKRLIKY